MLGHIVVWGDCGGKVDTCTADKCTCKGSKGGAGGSTGAPLTAAQLRRPEEPPPKRRKVAVKDDDEGSLDLSDEGSDAPSGGASDDSLGSGFLP
jgi:hypothetical protein